MKHPIPFTAILVGMFIVSQMIGLLVINSYYGVSEVTGEVEIEDLPFGMERPEGSPASMIIFIAIAILIGTGLMFLIIRFRKTNLWKVWYFLSVFITMSVALAAFIPTLIAAIISAASAIIKIFRPHFIIHNLTELFIYGGLAAIFAPVLNAGAAAILLLVISVYDMIAVWKSKHMVKLAQFQTQSQLFAGFSMPYKGTVQLGKGKKKSKKAEPQFAILGGGDVGFPLIFAGTTVVTMGFLQATVISLGAAAALTALLIFSQKGKFYPAMPFITAGCFIGYGIALLL